LTFAVMGVAGQTPAADRIARTKAGLLSEPSPYWAFAINPPAGAATAPKKAPDETRDDTPRHVPGSDAVFTDAQVGDLFAPPDWHPADHPAMPQIVSRGRAPEVYACGYCHLPNGQGRPENASLAGLPAAYIVQQMADFKNGLRKSSEPRHAPTSTMIAYETKATPQEIRAAADYFSALKPQPWIRVVETETVPKTHVSGWMLVADDLTNDGGGGTEPIGARIIETPENLERTELRDDRSGFIAYVPVGSIKRGEALVSGNSSKALRCATCHGRDLRGKGKAPRLAGRSPSYLVRQLYDIQHGSRAGAGVRAMKPAITGLTVDDMAAIAAYAASLKP
jgi:cytochrome c553